MSCEVKRSVRAVSMRVVKITVECMHSLHFLNQSDLMRHPTVFMPAVPSFWPILNATLHSFAPIEDGNRHNELSISYLLRSQNARQSRIYQNVLETNNIQISRYARINATGRAWCNKAKMAKGMRCDPNARQMPRLRWQQTTREGK